MEMHFDRWAAENLKNISFDQPKTKDGCIRWWNQRVTRLCSVVRKRPAYCWRQVAEWFGMTDAQMTYYFGPIPIISEEATWDTEKQKETAMTYLYGPNWKTLYQ